MVTGQNGAYGMPAQNLVVLEHNSGRDPVPIQPQKLEDSCAQDQIQSASLAILKIAQCRGCGQIGAYGQIVS